MKSYETKIELGKLIAECPGFESLVEEAYQLFYQVVVMLADDRELREFLSIYDPGEMLVLDLEHRETYYYGETLVVRLVSKLVKQQAERRAIRQNNVWAA